MYEHMTAEYLLQRMLARVPNDVDKREGSIIYNALAPAADELAEIYIEMDTNINLSFADTASEEYLTKRAAEVGVFRKPATKARRRGLFYDGNNALIDVPIGTRFRIDDVIYQVIGKITTGEYILECESTGTIGNSPSGEMLPIEYVDGLARAELTDIIEYGVDEEDDESLRMRYFANLEGQAFGGNRSDYEQKTLAIPGVGAVKIQRAWQGSSTVRLVILNSNYEPATPEFVAQVQEIVDPEPQGEGYGMAPIDHFVTVQSAAGIPMNIETTLTLDTGYTPENVLPAVSAKIEEYLDELRRSWQGLKNNGIIVRVALIDARILDVLGVLDITGTKINGVEANVTLAFDEVPVLGTVTING